MDSNKSTIIAGACIGLGLLLLGVFLANGIKSSKSLDRSVTVKGLSEIEVPANRVTWPIMYSEVGNDLMNIYNSIESKNKAILNFLTTNGVESQEIALTAPSVVDLQAERYNSNTSPYRYSATSVITVTSNKVDKIRELMSKQTALLKDGIALTGQDYRCQTLYMFTDLNSVKPQMIEEATKNARKSAEKFAGDSDSELGKIKKAYQGQLSIEDRDINTPYIKILRVVTTVEYQLKD